jgi:hypothetical protein
MMPDVEAFNNEQEAAERDICNKLANLIDMNLPEAENKIWHRHHN